MIVGFDHAVILVQDLELAVQRATDTGFTVSQGGQHDDQATRNAIIAFADGTYIQLLTFTNGSPPLGHFFADRFSRGFGLAEYALLSNDLDGDLAGLSHRGLPLPNPIHLGRFRPDGNLIKWKMSLPGDQQRYDGVPFLIQDITSRSVRVPDDAVATRHANGALGIGGVTVLVPAMRKASEIFRRFLNDDEQRPDGHFGSGRGLTMIPIPGGHEQWIALMQPVADSAPKRYFERFGAGPYALNLRTAGDAPLFPGLGTALPTEAFDGALIYLQGE